MEGIMMISLMLLFVSCVQATAVKDLVLLTVGSGPSDAQARFLKSADTFKYTTQVLGPNTGPVSEETKLELLKEAVAGIAKDHPDRLILYVDGPDAVITAGPLRVVEELTRDQEGVGGPVRVLISADGICWPDKSFDKQFPKPERGRKFIDSGAFVGLARDINGILQSSTTETTLQKLLTALYLKESSKKKFNMHIDHVSDLFQNLHGATGDMEIKFIGREGYLQNMAYSTVPLIVRANRENTRTALNSLSNYLSRAWSPDEGCKWCWEDMLKMDDMTLDQYPLVTLAIFITKPTPFMEEFFLKINNQTYPKNRVDLYIHNSVEFHAPSVNEWVDTKGRDYRSIKYIPADTPAKEWHTKNKAMEYCVEKDCSYLLVVDSTAHLDNPYVIKLLVEQNRAVIAPMLVRPHKAWSNFWGALTSDGFYARSEDYAEIVQNQRRGLWNVPFVGSAYIVSRKLFDDPSNRPTFINKLLEPDMAFCANLREKGVFMYVTNRLDMGHLVSAENFDFTHVRPEMWQIFENRWDWEARYLHPNYSMSLQENATIAMPCPDVYWFPVFTSRFAQEFIDINENYGKWSDGSHSDPRLAGGYETVPTVDIHMNQIEYKPEWMDILRAYIQPLQLRVFEGYNNDVGPPQALMAFTVRYKPDEQPSLRPHHDTSTYTINVGLNRPRIDYQGGGVRFIRYNCSVIDTKVGWVLMHPGRLTHLHEGLPVTGGTRYITVTFIDP